MKRPTGNEDAHAPSTTPDQKIKLKSLDANENAHASPSSSERIALIVVASLFGITICINVCCCYVALRETRGTSRGIHKEPRKKLPLLPVLETVIPPIGANGGCGVTIRGDEYLVTNSLTLDDTKVQNVPYSRRTSETASANSKASEDHPVDTESGREPCYT